MSKSKRQLRAKQAHNRSVVADITLDVWTVPAKTCNNCEHRERVDIEGAWPCRDCTDHSKWRPQIPPVPELDYTENCTTCDREWDQCPGKPRARVPERFFCSEHPAIAKRLPQEPKPKPLHEQVEVGAVVACTGIGRPMTVLAKTASHMAYQMDGTVIGASDNEYVDRHFYLVTPAPEPEPLGRVWENSYGNKYAVLTYAPRLFSAFCKNDCGVFFVSVSTGSGSSRVREVMQRELDAHARANGWAEVTP
jgi:hypothetical protein